jgi:ATP:corrinoid adenosyltransferase
MARIWKPTEKENMTLFLATFRGIPTNVVAYALARHTRGIYWVGCSKQEMAEDWCSESPNLLRGPKPKLDAVFITAKEIIERRATEAKRKSDEKRQWRANREAQEAEKLRIAVLDQLAYDLAIKYCEEHSILSDSLADLKKQKRIIDRDPRWRNE